MASYPGARNGTAVREVGSHTGRSDFYESCPLRFHRGYMLILAEYSEPIRPHAHESKVSRGSIITGNPPVILYPLCRRTHLPSRSLPWTTTDPENRFATIGTPSLSQQLTPLGPPSSPKRALGMFTPTTVEGLPTPSPQSNNISAFGPCSGLFHTFYERVCPPLQSSRCLRSLWRVLSCRMRTSHSGEGDQSDSFWESWLLLR